MLKRKCTLNAQKKRVNECSKEKSALKKNVHAQNKRKLAPLMLKNECSKEKSALKRKKKFALKKERLL